MLLYHLGADHLAEAEPYLTRMEREIATPLMALRVCDPWTAGGHAC